MQAALLRRGLGAEVENYEDGDNTGIVDIDWVTQ